MQTAYEGKCVGEPRRSRNTRLFYFPTPTAGGNLAIVSTKQKRHTLQVRDVLGRVVFSLALERGAEQMTVDLRQAGVSSGVYFLSVLEGGIAATGKLIVVGE
ncbi:MAG: T9SS type A sorting domain-containing protein [Saprospiraceae bacterium]